MLVEYTCNALLLHRWRRLVFVLLDPVDVYRNDPTHVHSVRNASRLRRCLDFLKHFRLFPRASDGIEIAIQNRVFKLIVGVGVVIGIPRNIRTTPHGSTFDLPRALRMTLT